MRSLSIFHWSWIRPAVLILLAVIFALSSWSNTAASAQGRSEVINNAVTSLVAQESGSEGGIPCTLGFAGPYPCHNVDLLAYLPLNGLAAGTAADIWGWTDPETGREYSILAHSSATTFVDVTDPVNPLIVGQLPAPVPNVLWRDVKVYNNHAYIVGDGDFVLPHGLQIFDLTQLRDVNVIPAIFQQTARYAGFGHAHNIAINEDTGFAYVVGSNTCSGGLHMIDLSDPVNPAFAGCFSQDGYTHDTQCVIYSGSDSEHRGKEICFASNVNTLTIVDVTNKNAPQMLSRTTYTGVGYAHQGWLSEDHAFFILGDEQDELNNGHNTHSYLWDLADLDAPVHFATYAGPTPAIDHNLFIKGHFVYESNYTSGLRILDASDIAQGNLAEVAFFDTHPASDAPVFAGTWSNYPFFGSGIVIVSNIEDGLYILRPHLPQVIEAQASGGGWLANNEGKKINFGFSIESTADGLSGQLQMNDKAGGAKVDLTQVTFVGDVSGACGSISNSQNSLEIHGNGTFNGDGEAGFRACIQDNGTPGHSRASDHPDLFYLECLSGCSYNTASRVPDDAIDGGNIAVTRSGGDEGGAGDSQPVATTMTLHPLLLTEGLVGQVQLFTVTAYDQDQQLLANTGITLRRTAADGSVESLAAITDLTGTATFSVVNLNQVSEYLANSGSAESNAIETDPLLK